MVRGKPRTCLLPLLCALFLIFCFLPLKASPAQEFGEETTYSLSENYRIELDALGDASITDTISYDPEWFSTYGYIFEENPNLLSRRFRADTNLGEIEDFSVKISHSKATVTVLFKAPGLAYLLDDGWHLFGYEGYRVVDEGDDQVVLEASWTLNNEFTLFEEMPLEEKVTILLPQGARNAQWDEKTGAVKYELPETAPAGGGLLYRHKPLFTALFSLLAALGLLLFLFVITRRTKEPVPVTGATAPLPGPPPPVEALPSTPPGQAHVPGPPSPPASAKEYIAPHPPSADITAPKETPAEMEAPAPSFCKKCGHPRGDQAAMYCRRCGAPFS